MGYSISMGDSEFYISSEHMGNILKDGRSMDGDYAWVHGDNMNCTNVDSLFEVWGYHLEYDDNLNAIGISLWNEKLGEEIKFFKVISKYVKEGSYIEMIGEEGERWKWVFKNNTCKEIQAKITYEWDDEE